MAISINATGRAVTPSSFRAAALAALACAIVLLWSPYAAAGPTCVTKNVIAFPTGLMSGATWASNGIGADLDRDRDGLVDAAEDELAACVVPHYHYDSAEPAREPFEPVMIYGVRPIAFIETPSGSGNYLLELEVRFGELYRRDGGYMACGGDLWWDWCDSHFGDLQAQTLDLLVTSLHTAEIVPPPDAWAYSDGVSPKFDGTHVNVFVSAGKHHSYWGPVVCENDLPCYDCPSCDLTADRANGNGADFVPSVTRYNGAAPNNYGQGTEDAAIMATRPELTSRGFLNALAFADPPNAETKWYSDEYVYDPCDQPDNPYWDCKDVAWKSFMNSDYSEVHSLHYAMIDNYPIKDGVSHAIFLRSNGPSDCTYAMNPPLASDDEDGDQIPNGCDPCGPDRRGVGQSADTIVGLGGYWAFALADDDADGIPNGCDLCPGMSDRGLGDGNLDGEADLQQPRRGDACDKHGVSSIESATMPHSYAMFENEGTLPVMLDMRNAQLRPDFPGKPAGGETTPRRCFCVTGDGKGKIDNPAQCNNAFGQASTACGRTGTASPDYPGGTGWLPFRSTRLDPAPSPEFCQPLGPGSNGEPEDTCRRLVQVSYDPDAPSSGEELWMEQPAVEWDVWGEIAQRLSDVGPLGDPSLTRVPAIPEGVQAPRVLFDWETSTPSQSSSIGDASAYGGGNSLLCILDPSCYLPKCSCDGVDCVTYTNGYYLGGGACILDALPYHVDGDVAFWSRVVPQKTFAPDDPSDSNWSKIHDSYSFTDHMVTSDRRGYTWPAKQLGVYKPDQFWWLHPEVSLEASPKVLAKTGGVPVILGVGGAPMSAVWSLGSGAAGRYGDLSYALTALMTAGVDISNLAPAVTGSAPGALPGETLPEWTVWDPAAGSLYRFGPDGVLRGIDGELASRQPGEALGPDRYELKSTTASGIMGRNGRIARVGDDTLIASNGADGWSFFRVSETAGATPLDLPTRWSDVRLVSVDDAVAVVGRITPYAEETSGPAVAVIGAGGDVRVRLLPDLPLRYGWPSLGRVEGRASLLVGGGTDTYGFLHTDVVELSLVDFSWKTLVEDSTLDPSQLPMGATVLGRVGRNGLELRALVPGDASSRTPPQLELRGGSWLPSGLAASDAQRTDVTLADRARFQQACSPLESPWWAPAGQLVWDEERAHPPLGCAAPAATPIRGATFQAVTAEAVVGADLWMARSTGLEHWRASSVGLLQVETLPFGSGATALAASPALFVDAQGATVEVRLAVDGVWTLLGSATLCDPVTALHLDGGTIWAVGSQYVTVLRASASSLRTMATYAVQSGGGAPAHLASASSCSASGGPLVASSMSGNIFALATADRIMTFDLRRAPELPMLGALPLDGVTVGALRTDGTWVYARLDGGTSGSTYPAWRIGPKEAFTAAGESSARAWIDGALIGQGMSALPSGTSLLVQTW